MLPLDLFDNSTFAGGNVVTRLAFTASAASFFFVVVHPQSTLGFEAAEAGAALVPLYVIMVIRSPLSGALADKIGAVVPIVGGLVVFATGGWWLSVVQEGSGYVTEPSLAVLLSVGLAALGAHAPQRRSLQQGRRTRASPPESTTPSGSLPDC